MTIPSLGVRIPPSPKPIPEGETECRCAHSLESQHTPVPHVWGLGPFLECDVLGCGCINGQPKA